MKKSLECHSEFGLDLTLDPRASDSIFKLALFVQT